MVNQSAITEKLGALREVSSTFSAAIPCRNTPPISGNSPGVNYFTFNNPPSSVLFCKPYSLTTPEGEISVSGWGEVLKQCCEYAWAHKAEMLRHLTDRKTSFKKAQLFSKDKSSLRRGYQLSNGIFIETNFSASVIVQVVCSLIKYCNFSLEAFSVAYSAAEDAPKRTPRPPKSAPSFSRRNTHPISGNPPGVNYFTFNNPPSSVLFCKPHLLTTPEGEIEVGSWGKVLELCCEYAWEHHAEKLRHLLNIKTPFIKAVLFATDQSLLRRPRRISNGFFIETNYPASVIVQTVCSLIKYCNFPLEAFSVAYSAAEDAPKRAPRSPKISTVQNTVPRHIQGQPAASEDLIEFFDHVFVRCFPKGFRADSAIDTRRFRNCWEEEYGETLESSDEIINGTVKTLGIEYESRIYPPSVLASEAVFEEMCGYIDRCLDNGASCIYYDAIFDEFSNRHADWRITSPEMLRSFLRAKAPAYSLRKNCIASHQVADISPISEIKSYLAVQNQPVSYEKIQQALPHLSLEIIKTEIRTSHEIVVAGLNEVIHSDIVDLSKEELEDIAAVIKREIASKRYLTADELWRRLQQEFPDYTNRYEYLPFIGVRNALKYKLSSQFSFQGNIISPATMPIETSDVMVEFCHSRNEFSLDDLNALIEDLGQQAVNQQYLKIICENSIRVSETNFAAEGSVAFNSYEIDQAISRFCPGDFIAINDVTTFVTFPVASYPWTSFLLESYVAKYSKEFELVHNQYCTKICAGAIVRKSSRIDDYNRILARVLCACNRDLDETAAVDYLCQAGFLGRRRYADIQTVLSEARQLKLKRQGQ